MGYVKIKVIEQGTVEDLRRWEDYMMEQPKCWNKFCLGLYGENNLRAVHVTKEGNEEQTFLTTLCEDCIKTTADYGVLVNESHLIVETYRKE